ncbi:MAG: response regulator transcription factor [Sphingobacteriia bacterium]|nr:response regulator transcription factor [Sphingobacteriia bacterium]
MNNIPEKQIKVLVIDDHQLIIDGMKFVLQDEEDVVFAGGAASMEEALMFLKNNNVDVVLADISMPKHSGIEITKKIKELYPGIQVLALTMHEDISMISKMVDAGASGYILKRTNMNELIDAIKVAASGGKYLSSEIQAILMENLGGNTGITVIPDDATAPLSARELEILNLIAKEFSNEQIAEKLFISERTVETHRRNIFTKTKTKTIVGLIKYAIKNGLINQENENGVKSGNNLNQ